MAWSSCFVRVGHQCGHKCPYKREAEEVSCRRGGSNLSQGWRLEWCGHKPRNADATRTDFPEEPLEGVRPCQHPDFSSMIPISDF